MQKIHKNLSIAVVAILVIGAAALLYFLFGRNSQLNLSSIEAKNGDITEEVNLSGQVKASQGVDLAFESQGKLVANYVRVGARIYAGQPLLAIDSSVLQAQLEQAQAQLDALNIDTAKSKTDASLQSLYSNSLSAAQKSVTTAKNILLTISDIQFNHFTGQTQSNIPLQEDKAKAVYSLLGQSGAELWTSQSIGQLNGGAYGAVQNAIDNPTQDNIDSALFATQTALQDVSNLVNSVPTDPALTSVERATINLSEANIDSEIITTSANIQAIATQKVNNSAVITTTNSQIEAASAAVSAIKTQISKTVITALFDGQVDKDNAVVGQIVSPNVPVITISNNNLEIDTNIPEVDLPDVKIGGQANITLDAFGPNVIFPATIFSVDSTQSVVNGISAYGARLKFKTYDSTVKPGMTANITIIYGTHTNVLVIPKSAVIQNNGKYFVVLDEGKSQKETKEITVGLQDEKNIEVISGLKVGDKVFAY
jgi:HlyD family secretion protein